MARLSNPTALTYLSFRVRPGPEWRRTSRWRSLELRESIAVPMKSNIMARQAAEIGSIHSSRLSQNGRLFLQ